MEIIKIKIAKDFSTAPGPRYIREGDWSGEQFRKEVLFPMVTEAIKAGKKIEVNLDGTSGYGTSFLEESFGGLIREEKMMYSEIVKVLEFISTEEDYLIEDIKNYLLDAARKEKQV